MAIHIVVPHRSVQEGDHPMSTRGNKSIVRVIVGVVCLCAFIFMLLPVPTAMAKSKDLSSPHTWYAQVGVESRNHAIQGMAFLPHELWIDVGDTVVWKDKAAEIHTVTFLKPGQVLPPFNPADPTQVLPQGSHIYDGMSYYNSGLMSNFPGLPVSQSYSLTFGVTGDFTYYCLVHPGMTAVIHVRLAGTSYPFAQEDYNEQIQSGVHTLLREGYKLADQAEDSSNNHHVTVGIGNGLVDVMRYFPQHIVIDVGDTITFVNRDMEPHTVTYGPVPASGDFAPYGDPSAFDGSSPLNSGFLGPIPGWFGTTYQVTFVKAGTYAFRCDLHDYLGMTATIVVKS